MTVDTNKAQTIIPRIVGALLLEDVSAKEAIDLLEEAKVVFLERSYHVTSKKRAD
ncbi:hypothetical protein ACWNS2_13960 [Planococcus plakortidis]